MIRYSTKSRTSLYAYNTSRTFSCLIYDTVDVSLISTCGILLDSSPLKNHCTVLVSRIKLKASEYRGEQAEMNIQRLNVRIDQVTDFNRVLQHL